MKSIKRTIECVDHLKTTHGPNSWTYHREDGPAYIREFYDGPVQWEWWHEDDLHRYGGPSVKYRNDIFVYYVHHNDVTELVRDWLYEHDYEWETMSDVEKWELDMFMRTLG